jgi:phage shock protein PspC (stress-responsive transcriptional regulator)
MIKYKAKSYTRQFIRGVKKMNKKIYLSDGNKKIAGVCGGLGEYFGIDPTIIRIIWFLLFFLEGIGLLAYFIGWIVIPRRRSCKYDNW